LSYGSNMPRKLVPAAYLEPIGATTGRRSIMNVFGTSRARSWCMPDGGTDAGIRAARFQHDIALQLRAAIAASESKTVAEFVRRNDGFTYDRLRAILSGDLWMRLDDVVELSHLLGLRPLVHLEAEDDDESRPSRRRGKS
jgi:hypothetical protein